MAAGTTYSPIATVTLGSALSQVTFSSIPSSYTDLVLIVNVKAVSGQYPILKMLLNGDAGANYSRTYLIGDGTSATSARASNQNQMYPGPGSVSGISDGTNTFSTGIINLMNYSNTTTYKTVISRDANPTNTVTANGETGAFVNLWRNTAAINSILITTNNGNNYDVGSTFSLYGIAAA